MSSHHDPKAVKLSNLAHMLDYARSMANIVTYGRCYPKERWTHISAPRSYSNADMEELHGFFGPTLAHDMQATKLIHEYFGRVTQANREGIVVCFDDYPDAYIQLAFRDLPPEQQRMDKALKDTDRYKYSRVCYVYLSDPLAAI